MPKRKASTPAPAKKTTPSAAKKAKAAESVDETLHFVLAHAAGHHPAGAKHPTMQRWAAALQQFGTVHDALVYPKPFNLMPRLVQAHIEAIQRAKGSKVVLVGVGMGARVAVHLLSGLPGDDGKPLPAVPPAVRECIAASVAIDYPLLRVGTREVRSAPLLALPADMSPLLLVCGPSDKHADAAKLGAIVKQMKGAVSLLKLESGSESPNEADLNAVVARAVAQSS